jgi:hypothetical protein
MILNALGPPKRIRAYSFQLFNKYPDGSLAD